MSGIVDGVPFAGTIITNDSVGVGVGAGSVGTLIGTTMAGGNSGRAMLFSKAGENIQCQFNYQSGKALGECLRSNGVKYLMTTNPPK
ncbi:hypothetical protein CBM2629_A150438 [Cupriavidus taiwanensis]|nr:hypothetical protein CBM2629_A150438 [Cupriavidus taiwanensis]